MNTANVKHPCYGNTAHHTHGRIHLPVAPRCNIQCNYCDRKFDCVNESRPGVTSAVLSPPQAMQYLEGAIRREPRISVVGIAGPGDPFANADQTMETLRLTRAQFPELILCLSSNGLEIGPHIQELHDLGVRYVTLTINAVDPIILAEIYDWVRFGKRTYRGLAAARLLLEKQLDALDRMKSMGFTVKINTVILPGINDAHIPELARQVKAMGADRMNPIPVYPNTREFFQDMAPPTKAHTEALREVVAQYLPVMRHCARCRADAAGMIGENDEGMAEILRAVVEAPNAARPYVAVATQEGLLINQHLGDATELRIYEASGNTCALVELRPTPPRGLGDHRWESLAEQLSDCRALLVGGVGGRPTTILQEAGIAVHHASGFIEDAVAEILKGDLPSHLKPVEKFKCGSECSGNGQGCS